MSFIDGQSLLTVFLVGLGSAIFLRIVAKEKRRREKYLQLRVLRHNQAAQEQERRAAVQAEQEAVTVIAPADLRRTNTSGR